MAKKILVIGSALHPGPNWLCPSRTLAACLLADFWSHLISEAWNMTATGFRFIDTYQVVAHKALRYLCQIYEEPIARTPMRFFPPLDKNQQAWRAHMEALQGWEVQEDSPIVVHLTTYLLALDEQYDQ